LGRGTFGKLQALPKNAKPINEWSNRDRAWLDVVKGIREAVKELAGEPGERKQKAPPTGNVTFLFTDIEGSFALWENYPMRMRAPLARRDEILRAAVEDNEGYAFKVIGDAYCAAFTHAQEALRAALAAQRAFSAEEWDEAIGLRVRMALHTGKAEEHDGITLVQR
jgi:class 3 adenylate cyclase